MSGFIRRLFPPEEPDYGDDANDYAAASSIYYTIIT